MKKNILILLLIFAAGASTSAQRFIERVYLKDSSYHEGYIIEQVPMQHLKIDRVAFKDTLTIAVADIWKITKIIFPDTIKNKLSVKAPIATGKKRYVKSVFLELLGNGGLYSVNYDMRTERNRRNGWGFKAGLSYFSLSATDNIGTSNLKIQLLTAPITLNYLFGKRKGFFELGLGATPINFRLNGRTLSDTELNNYVFEQGNIYVNTLIGHAVIGYRHIPLKKGIMYRVSFTPFITTRPLTFFVGFSVGYQF
jgi:hypothetical protein